MGAAAPGLTAPARRRDVYDAADPAFWIAIAYTAFVAVLVPAYWVKYGPANFLWFSDIALIGGVAVLWLEHRLLASMLALSVLLPELFWNLSFFLRLLTGLRLAGLVDYMFDERRSRVMRGLSLFHVFLPAVLIWQVARLGYDPRALVAQTLVAWVVLPVTYLVTDPSQNINWVFGPGSAPQRRIPRPLYLAIVMVVFPVGVYLPTHWLLSWLF